MTKTITYLLTNLITGESYVGLTTQTLHIRGLQHKSRAKCDAQTKLHKNIRTYGWNNFIMEELAEGDREGHFITELKPELNSDITGKGSNPNKGQIRTANKLRWRKVVCLETGKVYDNLQLAADDTGANRVSINNCCKGVRKTAGGFTWRYV